MNGGGKNVSGQDLDYRGCDKTSYLIFRRAALIMTAVCDLALSGSKILNNVCWIFSLT